MAACLVGAHDNAKISEKECSGQTLEAILVKNAVWVAAFLTFPDMGKFFFRGIRIHVLLLG